MSEMCVRALRFQLFIILVKFTMPPKQRYNLRVARIPP